MFIKNNVENRFPGFKIQKLKKNEIIEEFHAKYSSLRN